MIFIDRAIYKDKFGIYAIKNKINSKVYIGQTSVTFLKRYLHHNWKLRNNQHDNQYLQHAWNKYGENNFEFYIIEKIENPDLLDEKEKFYISYCKEKGISYNILYGGGGRRGVPMSDHAKEIVGKKNKEHMTGKKLSAETKEKMSVTRTGKYYNRYRRTTKLNDEIVRQIKYKLINGEIAKNIANELNISYSHVNNILSNNTWNNIRVDGWDEFLKNREKKNRLTKPEQMELYLKYINGTSKKDLCIQYNRKMSSLNQIIRNQRKIIT